MFTRTGVEYTIQVYIFESNKIIDLAFEHKRWKNISDYSSYVYNITAKNIPEPRQDVYFIYIFTCNKRQEYVRPDHLPK